jgi:hypothetical protein
MGAELNQSMTVEELSRLLQISGKIAVSDKTQELVAKHGDAIISAFLFEPDDNGFSRIQALTTQGGFLLNDARRQKLEQSGSAVKSLKLENGVIGYVGLDGAGPGGEGYIAIAHIPEKNIDIQFKIIIRNEGASPDSSEEVSRYHDILRNSDKLQKALNAVIAQGVSNLVKANHAASVHPEKPSSNSEKAEKAVDVAELGKNEGKSPVAQSAVAKTEMKPETSPGICWQIGSVAALVGLLAIWLKKRKSCICNDPEKK